MVTGSVIFNMGKHATAKVVESFMPEFKRMVVTMSLEHCGKGLSTLKFHLLDRMAEEIKRLVILKFLDASPFEYFNLTVKKS